MVRHSLVGSRTSRQEPSLSLSSGQVGSTILGSAWPRFIFGMSSEFDLCVDESLAEHVSNPDCCRICIDRESLVGDISQSHVRFTTTPTCDSYDKKMAASYKNHGDQEQRSEYRHYENPFEVSGCNFVFAPLSIHTCLHVRQSPTVVGKLTWLTLWL